MVSILNQFPAAVLCDTVYAAGCGLWLMWSANCRRNVLHLIVKWSLCSVAALLMLHTKHEQHAQSYMSRCGTGNVWINVWGEKHTWQHASRVLHHTSSSLVPHTYVSRSLQRTSSSCLHARRSYQSCEVGARIFCENSLNGGCLFNL